MLDDGPLSHASIHCKHSQHRSEITSSIHADFSLVDKQQLVVHWDGKIMTDTNNKDLKSKVDRLAVVVTGRELEKILGIVKLPSGTGTAQASATHQLLELWSMTSDVVAMCFDTTSTNTGTVKGACSVRDSSEQKFDLSTLLTPYP